MSDELYKARWNVKRAVLEDVAFEYRETDTAFDYDHADYLSDMLDEALKEYAEAYLMEQSGEAMDEFRLSFKRYPIEPLTASLFADTLDTFFNRRVD